MHFPIRGNFSGCIPRASEESVIEADYPITVNSRLSITPDIQVIIIRPSGSSAIENAFVLGAQVAVVF